MISINPFATTNALGSFSVQSNGYIQGMSMSDPSIRNWLAGGNIAQTETLPMWGGVGIYEDFVADSVTGPTIGRATSLSNLTGFSVFDQATSFVSTPNSPVPLGTNGQTASFFRLGSQARIPLAIDPSLISLSGGLITQQVSWDFQNQRLQAYDASTATVSITSQTATFNSSTGVYTIAVVAAAATVVGAVGDAINISGAVNSGTGGNGLVNGNQIVTSFTDSQHFSYQVTAVSGAIGTISGTMVLNEGTGALPIKILDINASNSMIVSYNPVTGFATWNKSGACALVLI